MLTLRRLAARVVTVAVLMATALLVTSEPAWAGQELLFDKGTYGANEVIRAEFGNGDRHRDCGSDGVNDNMIFTTTDFFIVTAGSVEPGAPLAGENVRKKVTLVYSSTAGFFEEVFAFTRPAPGGLGNGTYDIVFDECQDGRYDPAVDFIREQRVQCRYPHRHPVSVGDRRNSSHQAGRLSRPITGESRSPASSVTAECGTF